MPSTGGRTRARRSIEEGVGRGAAERDAEGRVQAARRVVRAQRPPTGYYLFSEKSEPEAGVGHEHARTRLPGAGSSISGGNRRQHGLNHQAHVQSKVRDQSELETLARALDLLREGKLPELGDLLSGRFVAVENAALTGFWQSGQFLEVAPSRLPGVAQTPLLLAAQRHSKAVDRAAGSWSRGKQDSWGSSYKVTSDEAGGKGKSKGGKGKGKTKKGKKSAWDEKPAENAGEAAKEALAERLATEDLTIRQRVRTERQVEGRPTTLAHGMKQSLRHSRTPTWSLKSREPKFFLQWRTLV